MDTLTATGDLDAMRDAVRSEVSLASSRDGDTEDTKPTDYAWRREREKKS